MKQHLSKTVYSMTKTRKHYGEPGSKYTPLFIQCNFFNIYMNMGNRNGQGPFLWCDLLGGFTRWQCHCLRLTHSILRGFLQAGYVALTSLLPTAQLQTAPAHREQVVLCSRQSLRLVSLPLFTFLKGPNIIIKHCLSWTFQNHGIISNEEWNIFFK